MSEMVPNVESVEGGELGKELARMFEVEAAKNPDAKTRCATCAFRAGDHLANNSGPTLMTAVKCVMERKPFWCHHIGENGRQKACAGWRLLVAEVNTPMPWDYVEGSDKPDGSHG